MASETYLLAGRDDDLLLSDVAVDQNVLMDLRCSRSESLDQNDNCPALACAHYMIAAIISDLDTQLMAQEGPDLLCHNVAECVTDGVGVAAEDKCKRS